jgi:hypothetical protein
LFSDGRHPCGNGSASYGAHWESVQGPPQFIQVAFCT